MVPWLTFITGSPGNSIRNRAAICRGGHQLASHIEIFPAHRDIALTV
jgi:hypothetical protein